MGTFEAFEAQKNEIMAQTGKGKGCRYGDYDPHSYNEYDSNGVSGPDLLGVFRVDTGGSAERLETPDDQTICKALKATRQKRTTWPMFEYDCSTDPPREKSALQLERYIKCDGAVDELFV